MTIAEPDPAWPARFRDEERRLREHLGPELVGRIEHVGSTAVPGLAAKPVLDLLVEVPSLGAAEREVVPRLERLDYVGMWTTSASPGHWLVVRGYGPDGYVEGVQPAHLHLAPAGHAIWERTLFRDRLRAHPEEAARYERLKRELAERHRHDREAYTEGKTDFVRELTERARTDREPPAPE